MVSGTSNGREWYWNIICLDGVYYHVDVLTDLEAGTLITRYDEDMVGYVWNTKSCPPCPRPLQMCIRDRGENDPEMMWMTTMNPATRRLIKVMPEDAERTAWYFDMLLGNGLSARKDFIAENGQRYLELADLS